MRLTEIDFETGTPIDGYGPGFFRIGGAVHEGHLLILPGQARGWGGLEDRQPLLGAASQIDVLFVGTGAQIAHIPADLRSELETAGIGVEIMASPTVCRTYNVLLSEGRRIGAALLTV